MKNVHHNQTYHAARLTVVQLLAEAIRLKDESTSELEFSLSNHLAKEACDNFHKIHSIFNKTPKLADDFRDHPNLYEITQFARKNGL